VRLVSVGVGALLACVALSLWWAGFAPFPTEPVLLASYQLGGYCSMRDPNWAKCSPGLENPAPSGSTPDFRLFPGPAGGSADFREYGQWGVEGFNGCWDQGCVDSFRDVGTVGLQWKLYMKSEVPFFGIGSPKWVRVIRSFRARPIDGVYPEAAYTTYGACMGRKPVDSSDMYYSCDRIEPVDPWRVGRVWQ
jgi:hypothetical protein